MKSWKNAINTISDFYTRTHIIKDGKSSDKVTFKLRMGSASASLGTDDRIGTFVDGIFYNEEAIKKLPVEKVALLSFDNDGFNADKIPDGNYAVPFSFKTKKSAVQQ